MPDIQKGSGSLPERSEAVEPTEDQTTRRETKLTEVVAAWVRQQPHAGPHPDIASKITSEHVSKSLEMVDAHDRLRKCTAAQRHLAVGNSLGGRGSWWIRVGQTSNLELQRELERPLRKAGPGL